MFIIPFNPYLHSEKLAMITITLTQEQLANQKVALAFQNLITALVPSVEQAIAPKASKRKIHRLKVLEDNLSVEICPEIQALFPDFKSAPRTLKTLELIRSNKVIELGDLQREYQKVFPNSTKRSLEATLRIIKYRLKENQPFNMHKATTHGARKTIFYWN